MNFLLPFVKKMNIIVAIHDSLYPIWGGGALRTIKTAKELVHRGHNVFLIAPSQKDEIEGIKVHRIPFITKENGNILNLVKLNLSLLKNILSLIKLTDIIFVHNAVCGFVVGILKFFFKFKFILDVTDIHTEYAKYTEHGFIEGILLPFMLSIEYWTMKTADRVIVVTQEMKKRLIENKVGEGKIEVVYDGVELERFENFEKENGSEKNVLCLGSMEKTDGVNYLVEVLPYVLKKSPDTKFYFVGGGGDFNELVQITKDSGVYNSCYFTGWIDYSQVREYMKKAGVGIISRPLNPPNHTVITLKLLEYWAGKIAVISSKLRGIEEITSNGKDILFFDVEIKNDLGEKIVMVLKNNEQRKILGRGGSETVRKFDWKFLIPQIVDYIV